MDWQQQQQKNEISVRELISTLKRKEKRGRGMNGRTFYQNPRTQGKSDEHHHSPDKSTSSEVKKKKVDLSKNKHVQGIDCRPFEIEGRLIKSMEKSTSCNSRISLKSLLNVYLCVVFYTYIVSC